MASPLIFAGQDLQAGQGQGQLSQYYGYADTTQTTVTAAALTNLSSVYTIPANEPYELAAYELTCGGNGTWGSTQQQLQFVGLAGTTFGGGAQGKIASTAFSASATFGWEARLTLTCADGSSSWTCRLVTTVVQAANPVNPGTAADNSLSTVTVATGHTASVSAAITVAVQAVWASVTGAPTITCSMTTFRKVA